MSSSISESRPNDLNRLSDFHLIGRRRTQTAARASIRRHPLAFSVLTVAAVVLVEVLLKLGFDRLGSELPVITVGIISGTLLSLLGAILVARLSLWRELGLVGRPDRARMMLWFLPFLIQGMLPLTQGFDGTLGRGLAAAAFGLLTSFWKLLVLGLILYAFLPRGKRSAAALTALGFGAMHVGGILTGGIAMPSLLLAATYVFLGFAFVAVRFRTGLLWPLVGCYAILLGAAGAVQTSDAGNLAASVADVLPFFGVSVLLACFGLFAWPRQGHSSLQSESGAQEEDLVH
jgi:hypothetical protein